MCNIISPTSLLLSATGTLAFKNCGLSDEVSTFAAPEMLQGRASSTKPAIERMLVYSLGMTLYWSVDFHLPQNQPVQLSDHLNSLLLSMCEDLAHRRVNLNSILEACESQHKASILPSPTKVIRQLVEEVFHESVSLDIHLQALGPEFVRMPDEQQIVLELPGSIVSRKGRSCSSQREVTVVLPNGQYVVVRCDIKSKARDVFDMVVAHANLVEHFYFGLAFLDDDEYFFLEHETKISKVAPDSWKKGQISSFLVFLRVKYFVDDISFILHKLTRHQYYLQLRKDILEDRLYCNEETGLFLVALALQAEFGDYMPELYGKNYYQPEHYVSKRMLEKLALPTVKEELPRLHASHAQMLPEEAEIEYLKIAQQLPEYGVMFHRVGREKRPVMGELVLGVCAKGIIVYEMKNHVRTVTRRFLWRETDSISTGRRKLIIECGGPSGKKHSFVTESSKIAQYLLNLCSAQHKFHSEMTSRQLNHTMIPGGNISVIVCNVLFLTPPEREIVCVNLKKDQKLGFGEFIKDNTGKLDLGIFIASIVPDGPADKDGRIKPGGRLISLNKTSLEGVTFSDAAAILQNSPDEVELIVSQPKRKICSMLNYCQTITLNCILSLKATYMCADVLYPTCFFSLSESLKDRCGSLSQSTLGLTLERGFGSPSVLSLKTGERFMLELKKSNGSLGISVAGGINTNVRYGGIYIKSLVPGGAADQDGSIQIGDRLLEVDGSNLRGVTHHQAVECLKRTGEVVNLLLEREPTVILEPRPDLPCPPLAHNPSHIQPPRTEVSMETTLSGRAKDYSFVTDGERVALRKSLSGLGFSFNISQLRSGPDRGSVVRIKRLFPGQPALESGQLREGDIILSVNKVPVKDLSYQRVLFLLRGAPSEVHLLICRPGPGLPYDVDDNTLVSLHVDTSAHTSQNLPQKLHHSQRLRRVWTVKCRPTSLPHLLLAYPHRPPHPHHLHHQFHQPHRPPQHHPPRLPHQVLALHRRHQSHNKPLGNQRNNRKWNQRRRRRTGKRMWQR
uniref:Non-specific protein-tyrosine kinase n=1 Tax=Dicentrarchus labrax TaxID=13489 RepID=A0A8C4DZS6_DICLA